MANGMVCEMEQMDKLQWAARKIKGAARAVAGLSHNEENDAVDGIVALLLEQADSVMDVTNSVYKANQVA